MKKISQSLLACGALLFSVHAFAAGNTLMDKVKAASAKGAPVNALSEDDYDAFTTHLEKGDQKWIALVPGYAPHTDAAYAEGLTISLASGLTTNPTAVLRVLTTNDEPPLSLKDACSIPFIEISDKEVKAYVSATLPKLQSVTDAALHEKRDSCIADMKKAASHSTSEN